MTHLAKKTFFSKLVMSWKIQNSSFFKPRSCKDDFSSKFHRRRAADNNFSRLCDTSRTTTYADHDQANKLVLALVLGSKAFYYRCRSSIFLRRRCITKKRLRPRLIFSFCRMLPVSPLVHTPCTPPLDPPLY